MGSKLWFTKGYTVELIANRAVIYVSVMLELNIAQPLNISEAILGSNSSEHK